MEIQKAKSAELFFVKTLKKDYGKNATRWTIPQNTWELKEATKAAKTLMIAAREVGYDLLDNGYGSTRVTPSAGPAYWIINPIGAE